MPRQGLVVVRPILPSSVQEDRVRLNLLTAIARVAADAKRDLQRTTANWNHRVTFSVSKTLSRRAADYGFTITTDDPIWGFLNEGTEVRYAIMTQDFEAKTQPDVLDSGEGHGGFDHWGQAEGIEARNWSKILAGRYDEILRDAVAEAMLAGFRNHALPRRGG